MISVPVAASMSWMSTSVGESREIVTDRLFTGMLPTSTTAESWICCWKSPMPAAQSLPQSNCAAAVEGRVREAPSAAIKEVRCRMGAGC